MPMHAVVNFTDRILTLALAAYATVFCPPVVCNVCIVSKRGIMPKNCL